MGYRSFPISHYFVSYHPCVLQLQQARIFRLCHHNSIVGKIPDAVFLISDGFLANEDIHVARMFQVNGHVGPRVVFPGGFHGLHAEQSIAGEGIDSRPGESGEKNSKQHTDGHHAGRTENFLVAHEPQCPGGSEADTGAGCPHQRIAHSFDYRLMCRQPDISRKREQENGIRNGQRQHHQPVVAFLVVEHNG